MLRAYKREWLVVLLISVTAFSFVYEPGPQDVTRLALAQSTLFDGSLRIDRWHRRTVDKALYGGHYYADKAPGLSFMALPLMSILRISGVVERDDIRVGVWKRQRLLWVFRVLTVGLGFSMVVFLVGRAGEALERGTGAATATAFGLGTLAMPLAATMFAHVVAAAIGFAAFMCAWAGTTSREHRQLLWIASGVAAGASVLIEYEAAVIAAILFVYLAFYAARAALIYAAAAAPGALALAAYNTAAFGSPFRLSYLYVAEQFAEQQSSGLFGIGIPDPVQLSKVLIIREGLLAQSPVLILGAVGLVLLWRRGTRAEAATCGAIAITFVLITAGYYDPIGGLSPGARFFTPALPFLAVGLPCTFRRWPYLTLSATSISIGLMMFRTATWNDPVGGSFQTIWLDLGTSKATGAVIVGSLAVAALVISARGVLTPTVASPEVTEASPRG